MELAVNTEYRTFSDYLVGYCDMMLVALIERLSLVLHPEDVPVIHYRIVFRLLLRIITNLLHCIHLCLTESNHLTQFVSGHIILPLEVESENVAVRDTVSEGILVEHVTEDDFRRDLLLCVLLEDRCTGKPEEHCSREGILDAEQHLSEHAAMTLIDYEDNSL